MNFYQFIRKTGAVKIGSLESKKIISDLIFKDFQKKDTTQERAQKLIMTAHQWNLPCLDDMLTDYEFEDFPLW